MISVRLFLKPDQAKSELKNFDDYKFEPNELICSSGEQQQHVLECDLVKCKCVIVHKSQLEE